MNLWYDRQGNPIDMQQAVEFFSDPKYKVVKQEMTPKGSFWVSTVWLGIDHAFGFDRPLIFETMVFDKRPEGQNKHMLGKEEYSFSKDLAMDRYRTEEEALKGHEAMLKRYTLIEENLKLVRS